MSSQDEEEWETIDSSISTKSGETAQTLVPRRELEFGYEEMDHEDTGLLDTRNQTDEKNRKDVEMKEGSLKLQERFNFSNPAMEYANKAIDKDEGLKFQCLESSERIISIPTSPKPELNWPTRSENFAANAANSSKPWNKILCPCCQQTDFRLIKYNLSSKKGNGGPKIRTQPDRCTWLRHLKHCPRIQKDLGGRFDQNSIKCFLKAANVSMLDSQSFPSGVQVIANVFLKHWYEFQEMCLEAIADVQISKYLKRMTSTLVRDRREASGTRFVPISMGPKPGFQSGMRICIVIALEKPRRSRKQLDYEKLPKFVENLVQEKLVGSNIDAEFKMQRMTNGGYEHQALIIPLELRVARCSDLVLMKVEKIMKEISIWDCLGCCQVQSFRYRLFFPVMDAFDNAMAFRCF